MPRHQRENSDSEPLGTIDDDEPPDRAILRDASPPCPIYLYLPMSLLVSLLALGEKLSGRMLLGTLLVLAANALVLWHQIRSYTLHADLPEPA